MTRDIPSLLAQHEHLTTVQFLVSHGHSVRSIGRAVERGQLLRVCRGWVATPDARQDSIIAVMHRGKLAGPSALASRGTWDGVATRLHVQRAPNVRGTEQAIAVQLASFRPREFMPTGVVTRWRAEQWRDPREPPWRQSVIDALAYVAKYAPFDQFIACVDSALHESTLSRAGLAHLGPLLPASCRDFLAYIDPAAGSGLETLPRVRLAPLVRTIDTQVAVPGIARSGGEGAVDLVIDKWLAFEADGDRWHDPVADRIRNQVLVLNGFRPHRFGFEQIVFGWPRVEATVLELLRYPPPRR